MALPPLPLITPNSLRHRVVVALRDAIITGSFQPGDRITEEDIARQMGISRGTVREALRQLEQEGLVISLPYRGTEVVGISYEEVTEILFPIRLILERYAFTRALPQLTEADLDALESIVSEMHEAAFEEDLPRLVNLDVQYHELVISRAGLPHCEQIWRTISPRVRVFFYRNSVIHTSLHSLVQEHRELLDAIRSRDVDSVLAVLQEHICVPITSTTPHEPD